VLVYDGHIWNEWQPVNLPPLLLPLHSKSDGIQSFSFLYPQHNFNVTTLKYDDETATTARKGLREIRLWSGHGTERRSNVGNGAERGRTKRQLTSLSIWRLLVALKLGLWPTLTAVACDLISIPMNRVRAERRTGRSSNPPQAPHKLATNSHHWHTHYTAPWWAIGSQRSHRITSTGGHVGTW